LHYAVPLYSSGVYGDWCTPVCRDGLLKGSEAWAEGYCDHGNLESGDEGMPGGVRVHVRGEQGRMRDGVRGRSAGGDGGVRRRDLGGRGRMQLDV
jgi:hypothetical protein